MDENREVEIIRKVLLGDPQPFEFLVREYQSQIYSLMLRSVKGDDVAGDLAQEVFMKAYSKLETFNMKKRFFPWLYTIALNVVRDHVRNCGRDIHVYMDDPEPFVSHGGSGGAMDRQLDGNAMFAYIETMAPKYREALILRYKYEFTMQEIAEALGISSSGAKMRVKRGLENMRSQFKEALHDHSE